MTQTPPPAPTSAQDDITEIQIASQSKPLPVPPPPPSKIGPMTDAEPTELLESQSSSLMGDELLEMTELNYYSATESRRLRSRMQATAQATSASTPGPASSGQRFGKRWANLSLRNKFVLLILLSSALPTIAVTQSLVSLNKNSTIQTAEAKILSQAEAFQGGSLEGSQDNAKAYSVNLARALALQGIDPSNVESDAEKSILSQLVALPSGLNPEQAMNFQIVVDIKGRTIAQDIWQPNSDAAVPADIASAQASATLTQVSSPLLQDIRRFPLVQQVLSTGVGASGVERLISETNQKLQLTTAQQAEDGPLTSVSVEPILLNGRTRGAVITGQVLTGNHILADVFKLRSGLSSLSLLDGEKVVFSTQAGANGTGRQTTEKVTPEILDKVLKQGEKYVEIERVNGILCLHYYLPIFNQSGSEPVGIIHAAQALSNQESQFLKQQLIAYGLGGSLILLSTLLALPAAGSLVRPLKRLSGFMERLGKGDRGLRVSEENRQDEVGQLSLNMNKLATNLERNERLLEQQTWQSNILAEIANLRSLNSYDLAEGLENALEKIRRRLKVDRLVIYRCGAIAQDGRTMYEAQIPSIPSAVALNVMDTCIPQAVLDSYLAGNVKANSDVTQAGFGPEHLELLAKLNVKASLIVPIFDDTQLYGLMVAHSCKDVRQWRPKETELMQLISGQAAATLAYVTLLEQQRGAEESIRQDKETLQRRALELLQEVDPVSQGDLTVRAKVTPDEIGTVADSYNATVESLRKIVTQVQNVSTQVTSTAQSNDIAVTILAQDALAQAEKITGSLSSIEAMSQSVQQLATQAQEARAIVNTTQTTVSAGEQAMVRTVEGMASIRESVSETTQKMESLETASERISNVIRLISGFAAQTHMLAMKASIEAARAGEEGEGFAVIADEVRSLAAQSAQATADVETVINTIQMATQDVIAAMEVENSQVAKQMELVEETRASLNQITAASAEVNQLVSAIAQTTETQTKTSDATAAIITEVAQLVRNTSEEASQVSDSFKQLVDVSQALQSEVAQFKVT